MDEQYIVINKCFGGFGLSVQAWERLYALKGVEGVVVLNDVGEPAEDDDGVIRIFNKE